MNHDFNYVYIQNKSVGDLRHLWEKKKHIHIQSISDVIYMFPAGTYECGFMLKSVRHIAKTHLSVALLPDDISLTIDPLTVDCSETSETHKTVKVTATIQHSPENFKVWWSLKGVGEYPLSNTCKTNLQLLKSVYFIPSLNCNMKTLLWNEQYNEEIHVKFTYKNLTLKLIFIFYYSFEWFLGLFLCGFYQMHKNTWSTIC